MPEVFDRRAALEEAFESAEADAKGEEYTPPVREEVSPIETTEVKPEVDAVGEVELKDASKKEPKGRTKGIPPELRGKGPEPTDKVTTEAKPNVDIPAPQGWGATRDALWAKVPADVRQVIAKRELEIQQGMSRAGNVQKVANEYVETIKPFENIIRSMNTTPKDAIRNVMTTASALITGPQHVKAAVLVEMIMNYGVDLKTLDTALSAALEGKPVPGGAPTSQQPAALDPRILQQLQPLFQLQERLTQEQGRTQERLQEEAVVAINSVQSRPHFEDVREDMADIMEMSAKRGVVMTIDQAYDKAVQLNPEVSKIVGQRTKANDISRAASTLARSRKAASTVSGAPGSAAMAGGKQDRRAALEAAWDGAS